MTISELFAAGEPHSPAEAEAWGLAVSGALDALQPDLPGFWLGNIGTMGTGSPGDGVLWARPVPILRPTVIDRMACGVTTAAADSVVRLGVYRVTPGGSPNFATLVFDAGTVDTSSTGNKELALSPAEALSPGAYIFAAVPQGGDPTLRIHTGNAHVASIVQVLHTTAANSGLSGGYRVWWWGGLTGSLPATLASPGQILTGSVHVLARLA